MKWFSAVASIFQEIPSQTFVIFLPLFRGIRLAGGTGFLTT